MKVHGSFIQEKGLRGSMNRVGIEKETEREREQEPIIFLEYYSPRRARAIYVCMHA